MIVRHNLNIRGLLKIIRNAPSYFFKYLYNFYLFPKEFASTLGRCQTLLNFLSQRIIFKNPFHRCLSQPCVA